MANPLKWGPCFCCHQWRDKLDKTTKHNTNNMLAVLWHYYKALLHLASPLYVAPSRVPLGGLGLFTQHGTSMRLGASPFMDHLWAVLFEVNDATFAKLWTNNYLSLYGLLHILCGPLTLANHQCERYHHPQVESWQRSFMASVLYM
ncbi:uncharacterized protein ACA1_073600 [Acanthamoeba castellanii str. Neff]|uniref:Uncharacterized protein n=1 Tax=Acanthamoeba castellanii (strain ATCC 30010 / Neff) TaxID=1257118 RepID=L8HEX6_ACACF|nr:uncharacterized protein ACA1_073600 [Acanthamoeba castellanii str. Neff]ELR23715.1 hypothetical protein ACA1_073600 [Acanthamoeba castellanii str. Neff]